MFAFSFQLCWVALQSHDLCLGPLENILSVLCRSWMSTGQKQINCALPKLSTWPRWRRLPRLLQFRRRSSERSSRLKCPQKMKEFLFSKFLRFSQPPGVPELQLLDTCVRGERDREGRQCQPMFGGFCSAQAICTCCDVNLPFANPPHFRFDTCSCKLHKPVKHQSLLCVF